MTRIVLAALKSHSLKSNGILLAYITLIDQTGFPIKISAIEKDYMKTVNDLTGHIEQADFDRFVAAYPSLDTAARLCADYCITVEGFTALTREIQTRVEQKSSRTFTRRSNIIARSSLEIQPSGFARRRVEMLKNYQQAKKGWWKRFVSAINNRFDGGRNSKASHGGLAFE
jgi:hypothetical protein